MSRDQRQECVSRREEMSEIKVIVSDLSLREEGSGETGFGNRPSVSKVLGGATRRVELRNRLGDGRQQNFARLDATSK